MTGSLCWRRSHFYILVLLFSSAIKRFVVVMRRVRKPRDELVKVEQPPKRGKGG